MGHWQQSTPNTVTLPFPLLRSILFRIVVLAARVCPAGVLVIASGELGGGILAGILAGIVKIQKDFPQLWTTPIEQKGIMLV